MKKEDEKETVDRQRNKRAAAVLFDAMCRCTIITLGTALVVGATSFFVISYNARKNILCFRSSMNRSSIGGEKRQNSTGRVGTEEVGGRIDRLQTMRLSNLMKLSGNNDEFFVTGESW